MNELDHGRFFTTHRISDVENLAILTRHGLRSQKYKPVDYRHLYELAEAERMASAKIQSKIKKTEQVSKINKEQMLLKQHRQVWWQEHKRLSESRQKAEAEIKTCLDEESHKDNFFSDMRDLENKLSKERDTYQRNTVAPIWQLRENLKFRLSEMQCYLSEEACLKSKINPVEVLQQIKFAKKQHKAILESLILESLALERELEDYNTKALVHSFETNGLFLEVPSALLSLECPYPELKTLVVSEYQKLARGYGSKLQEIDQQLEVLYRNADWKKEDQWVFETVINQYPRDLQNRRTLYLDVLQRYLPHKSRRDLVVHEMAWERCHCMRNQRRALMFNWAQARKAFLLKAETTVAEASAAHETEAVLASARQKQQEICAELKAKVLRWRAQQEEAAKLEAAIAARRKEKQDEKDRLRKEQELIRRAQEKEKVKKYWAEKELKWQEQEEKDLQRLEELRKLMAEQAAKDRERVKFRRALLEKRLLEKKELALQEAREEEEKEKCLERLRQQEKSGVQFLMLQDLQPNVQPKENKGGRKGAPQTLLVSDTSNSTNGAALSLGLPVVKSTVLEAALTSPSVCPLASGLPAQYSVAVVAQLDPARVVADTVASKARAGVGTKEEFDLQKPLFKLHTYSEEQIISDPRLRVELALREAGLHKTLYAKEILTKISPLKIPRRDMESTAFKM